MSILVLLLSVAFFLQQAQLSKIRRKLNVISDVAASFMEDHSNE